MVNLEFYKKLNKVSGVLTREIVMLKKLPKTCLNEKHINNVRDCYNLICQNAELKLDIDDFKNLLDKYYLAYQESSKKLLNSKSTKLDQYWQLEKNNAEFNALYQSSELVYNNPKLITEKMNDDYSF